MTTRPQFVLVHGAWHGAWCWSRVLPLLRAQGHVAHAAMLTGTGERAHLLRPGIHLATHVDDVVALIRCEELDDVVLVGHSYGGVVITGVADVLTRTRPGPLHHLVYLDASAPRSGESWSSPHKPEVVAARIAAAAASGGLSLPPPDASVFGLSGSDRDWVNRRQTPQPFALYKEPLHYDEGRVHGVPRTFIDCNNPPLSNIDPMRRRVRTEPGWRVIEMATGHDPMVSMPVELAAVLLRCAA
ncbi:MAG: alpha/beta hydrolase [Betaproteobacteria bacterium]